MRFDRYRKRLGARMAGLRHAAGLTQQEVAGKAGLTRQHLRLLEIGVSDPKLSTLVGLADAFGVSLPDLVDV